MTWYPKAIIFDMDGLLVDSEPVWSIAERALLESRGKPYNPHAQKQFIGLGMKDFWSKMCVTYGLSEPIETLVEEVSVRMCELIPRKVVARPGAVELIRYVAEEKFPRAVASSSPISIIESVLTSQGWKNIFPVYTSGDEVPNGKPAPDVYLETARRLKVSPADCLALEDSPNGARAAVAAGMVCYAVPDLSHTHVEAFANITPYVFESLHGVLAELKQKRR